MQNSAAPSTPQEIPYRARFRQPNGPFRPSTWGSKRVLADLDILSMTISPVMEARRLSLPPTFGRGQALHALVQHKALDLAAMRLGLGPDHEHIGDGGVGNPHLGAVQNVAIGGFLRHGLHARRVGPGIRFGQAKAADPFTRGQFRQVFLALFFGAVGVDRIHHRARIAPTSSTDSPNPPALPHARSDRRRRRTSPSRRILPAR